MDFTTPTFRKEPGFSLVRTGTRHSNDFILAGGHQEIQGGAERFICFQNAERQIGVVIDQLPLSVCRSATVFLFDLAANALNLADHRLLEVFAQFRRSLMVLSKKSITRITRIANIAPAANPIAVFLVTLGETGVS